MTGIENCQGCEASEWESLVQPKRCPLQQPIKAARQCGLTDWHVFVVRLIGCGAPSRKVRDLWALTTGARARVVILHFMVIPGHDPGAGRMHGLQIRILSIESVALAIVIEGYDPSLCDLPNGMLRSASRVFIDVVTEKEHQIWLVLQHLLIGAEIAMLIVLT